MMLKVFKTLVITVNIIIIVHPAWISYICSLSWFAEVAQSPHGMRCS